MSQIASFSSSIFTYLLINEGEGLNRKNHQCAFGIINLAD
jgi:hypothetical protein